MATHTSRALRTRSDDKSGTEAPDSRTALVRLTLKPTIIWSNESACAQKVQNTPALISELEWVMSSWLSCRNRNSARTPR